MSTGMVLSIGEPLNYFNRALSEYAGPAAFTVDALAAAEVILDKLFYGAALRELVTGHVGSVQQLISEHLRVPTDVRNTIAEKFEEKIKWIVYRVVTFEPNQHYTYRILESGDLMINKMDLDPAGEVKDPNTVFDAVAQGEFTDGFTPERMRR